MNKTIRILMAAALAAMMGGAAMAGNGSSHICAYVNDNVNGPNFVEGYKVGPGDATVHVGPYATNGKGAGGGDGAGGYGATRVRESDLYVSDGESEDITHFKIRKADCTLTVDTTVYYSGDSATSFGDILATSPDGTTMFVGSVGDNMIYSHTIAANGSLGSTVTEASAPDTPAGVEVSADGKTLAVSYYASQEVCAYPIVAGHLGAPNCQLTAGYPVGISIDSASACVYAGEDDVFGSEVAAVPLTAGVLGAPTDYNSFGTGLESMGVLVGWNNKTLYVTNAISAQTTIGAIALGCKLTYRAIVSDGSAGVDNPSQVAQDKTVHNYVVTGDYSNSGTPSMGIFRAGVNGKLTPIGSGQFPLMSGVAGPRTVVVVGSE